VGTGEGNSGHRRTVGTEEQRNSRHRGTLDKEERRGTLGIEEQWAQRNSRHRSHKPEV